MRKLIFYLLCLSFLFIPWSGSAQSRARAEALSLAVEKDLTAGILPFWLDLPAESFVSIFVR